MSEEQTAAFLNGTGYRADRAIDTLTRSLAGAIFDAVMKHSITLPDGSTRLTTHGRVLVMKEVRALHAEIYGARPTTQAQMFKLIAGAALAAHEQPFDETVAFIRDELKDDQQLLEALGG